MAALFVEGGRMPTLNDAIPVVSLIIALLALLRNMKGDSKAEGAKVSEILVKIALMQDDLKEIKADFKAELRIIKEDVNDLKERLVIVEQSCKSAHKRIDGLHGEHIAEE